MEGTRPVTVTTLNTFRDVPSLGLGRLNFRDISEAYSGGSSTNIGFFLKAICPLKVCILSHAFDTGVGVRDLEYGLRHSHAFLFNVIIQCL